MEHKTGNFCVYLLVLYRFSKENMVLHVHGFIIEHHPGDNPVAATSPQPGKILKSEISLNRPLLDDY